MRENKSVRLTEQIGIKPTGPRYRTVVVGEIPAKTKTKITRDEIIERAERIDPTPPRNDRGTVLRAFSLLEPASYTPEERQQFQTVQEAARDYLQTQFGDAIPATYISGIRPFISKYRGGILYQDGPGFTESGVGVSFDNDRDSLYAIAGNMAEQMSHAAVSTRAVTFEVHDFFGSIWARAQERKGFTNEAIAGSYRIDGRFLESAMAKWDAVRIMGQARAQAPELFAQEAANAQLFVEAYLATRQGKKLRNLLPPEDLGIFVRADILGGLIPNYSPNLDTYSLRQIAVIRGIAREVGYWTGEKDSVILENDEQAIEFGRKILQQARAANANYQWRERGISDVLTDVFGAEQREVLLHAGASLEERFNKRTKERQLSTLFSIIQQREKERLNPVSVEDALRWADELKQ